MVSCLLANLGFEAGQEAFAENLDAKVHIDNVKLKLGGHTGDLIEVDLKQLNPADTAFVSLVGTISKLTEILPNLRFDSTPCAGIITWFNPIRSC